MITVIFWIAVGAALMYFFDPVSGRARRAWLSEKIDQVSKKGTGPTPAAGTDAGTSGRSTDPPLG